MYCDFHGLRLRPFETTDDPSLFLATNDNSEALASLEYASRVSRGVAMLTGDAGCGKTMLARVLIDRLGDSMTIVKVRRVPESAKALLRTVAKSLGLSRELTERDDLLEAIETEVGRRRQLDMPAMLLVDDAHGLSDEVLTEIRLLSDLEASNGGRLPILLIGDCSLASRLTGGGLESLRQRVSVAHRLRPLTASETARYLEHRLGVAASGNRPFVRFDAEAVEEIYRVSGGVPRLVDVAADHCLLLAYVRCTHVVDRSTVESASLPLVERPGAIESHEAESYRRAA